MLSREITLVNSVGLHARPASYFAQKAISYKCSVWIENNSRRANAKSLLGILALGVKQGDSVTLTADGVDEEEALEGLCALILSGFPEKG